jgi:quercetin dioxygenase-like cupin family protein
MSHYITTHDDANASVFSSTVPEQRHVIEHPGATVQILYSAHTFPPNLSSETDITQFAHDRLNGFGHGELTPATGFSASIVSFPPGAESGGPFHRTLTLDIVVILEGEVELHLDSGEKKVLKQGDSVTQRGTIHQWRNISGDDKWLRFVAFIVPIVKPFVINGQNMDPDFNP